MLWECTVSVVRDEVDEVRTLRSALATLLALHHRQLELAKFLFWQILRCLATMHDLVDRVRIDPSLVGDVKSDFGASFAYERRKEVRCQAVEDIVAAPLPLFTIAVLPQPLNWTMK